MTLNPFAILGQILSAILPDPIVVRIQAFIDQVTNALKGETLLAIGNGAGVVIYLVAKASGKIPDVPLEQAIIQAGTAAALLNSVLLAARQYVYSPKKVDEIVATKPTSAGPIAAAKAAGVDTTLADAVVAAAPEDEVDTAAVLARLDKLAAADEG